MADPCQGIMDQRHFEAYQEPPCLWKLVEEHVPPEERLEIKSILGEAMVDLSLELHAEVETLMAMWRDERGRFLSLSEAQNQLFSPVLADPPTVKEMLRQEINLLLLDIRQKAREQGRDENKALQIYNQDVVNFAMGASRARSRANQSDKIASRPGSALSIRDGQEVPIRPLTGGSMADDRPVSSLSSSSSLGDYMETIADKLNLLDINEAVIHLQSTLKEECRMLEQDCNFLQGADTEYFLRTSLHPQFVPYISNLVFLNFLLV
ncbi:coiled-coil domain-containing protein 24 [Protopterus annectens]|uniref:coiled-coil domain-containing protein 24 n=1 Tax=Protopterus annectens TaxID=7888 RepID=UPI001CFB5139|nr:coiled-coil domain-containing protein 24 [Protopterus annectens]